MCNYSPAWAYKCESNKCVKTKYSAEEADNMGFAWCRHTCINSNETNVLPSVQQLQSIQSKYIKIKTITFRGNNANNAQNLFWEENVDRFYRQLENKYSKLIELSDGELHVVIDININSDNIHLTMDTDESYNLQTSEDANGVKASISAESIFGARHALETLIQMIFYDEFSNTLVVSLCEKS